MHLPVIAVLWAASWSSGRTAPGEGCSGPPWGGPVMAALVDLHTDDKCSWVDPRGVQQLAALERTLKTVNNEFKQQGIEIVLQVFDTCSSSKVTIASTLKALVATKQTCLHPPLFLGFIGPERSGSLKAVRNLTQIFGSVHILPYSLQNATNDTDILYIAKYPVKQSTKAVLLLAVRLGWKSVSVIFEESLEARLRAEDLVVSLTSTDSQLCVAHQILQVHNKSSLRSALHKKIDSDGIIIILDSIKWSFTYLKSIEDFPNQIILSLSKIGLRSWELSCRNHSIFLLQQVSGSPITNLNKIYDGYLHKLQTDQDYADYKQMCKQDNYDCSNNLIVNSLANDQDWTVSLMEYGVMLLGAALRVSYYTLCKSDERLCPQLNGMPTSRWNALLSSSNVFVRPSENSPANKKVYFGMEHQPRFNVYTNFMMDNLEKVAWIDNNVMFVAPWYRFPSVRGSGGGDCRHGGMPPPMVASTTATPGEEGLLDIVFSLEHGYYQTMGILAGISTTAIIAMAIIICLVYRTFKVRSNHSGNSYSENSSRSRRPSVESG